MASLKTRATAAWFIVCFALLAVLGLASLVLVVRQFSFVPHITLPLLTLSLETFLVFKTASCIPSVSSHTTPLNRFFYESRNGSFTLLALCVVWLYGLVLLGGDTLINIFTIGLGRWSSLLKGLVYFLFFVSVLQYLALMGWIFWTGALSLWRIAAPTKTPALEDQSGTALLSTGEDDWDEWQDDSIH
ncbi:hypothetical protein G7046_g2387 [Stylonectria norvegica]|nr:hypothetical protein G7046_g2387 [Stylonectria norvegica]